MRRNVNLLRLFGNIYIVVILCYLALSYYVFMYKDTLQMPNSNPTNRNFLLHCDRNELDVYSHCCHAYIDLYAPLFIPPNHHQRSWQSSSFLGKNPQTSSFSQISHRAFSWMTRTIKEEDTA